MPKSKTGGQKKVLIIGLDGAEWDLIDRLFEEDELPNLKELSEKGGSAELESTVPSISPVAWTSFMTGKNPGKHGIYSFMEVKDDEEVPNTAKDVKARKLWNITSENGLRSVVMNVPMTYPPEEIKGKMVSGYLSVEGSTFTHPERLGGKLKQKGYKVEALSEGFEEEKRKEFLKELDRTVEKRTEIALELMGLEDWNLFVLVYTGLDRIQHYYWKYMGQEGSEYSEAIYEHYRKLDEMIGRLTEKSGDSEVIVMSDHGFTGLKGEVYLNHWLRKEGYLKLDRGGKDVLSKVGITQQSLITTLKEIGFFGPVKKILKPLGIYKKGKNLPELDLEDIDFEESRAYAGNFGGKIYLLEQDEDLKKELKGKLEGLEHPETGEKFFEEVYYKEDLYEGGELENAPDLVVTSKKWDAVGYLGYGRLYSEKTEKSGHHKREGILMTSFSLDKDKANICDITPTVLDILGLTASKDMDGESLTD